VSQGHADVKHLVKSQLSVNENLTDANFVWTR